MLSASCRPRRMLPARSSTRKRVRSCTAGGSAAKSSAGAVVGELGGDGGGGHWALPYRCLRRSSTERSALVQPASRGRPAENITLSLDRCTLRLSGRRGTSRCHAWSVPRATARPPAAPPPLSRFPDAPASAHRTAGRATDGFDAFLDGVRADGRRAGVSALHLEPRLGRAAAEPARAGAGPLPAGRAGHDLGGVPRAQVSPDAGRERPARLRREPSRCSTRSRRAIGSRRGWWWRSGAWRPITAPTPAASG